VARGLSMQQAGLSQLDTAHQRAVRDARDLLAQARQLMSQLGNNEAAILEFMQAHPLYAGELSWVAAAPASARVVSQRERFVTRKQ